MKRIGFIVWVCLLISGHALPQSERFDVSVTQQKEITAARRLAQLFIRYANSGNLSGAKNLCSKKIDTDAPSTGDGTEPVGFTSGKAMKKVWLTLNFKIQSVEYLPKKGKTGPYYIVWLRPAKGKRDGDTGLVYKPSLGKFVSIFDASE